MVKCPRCGKESEETGKEWNYSAFKVKSFKCPAENKKFNAYYREGKLACTIPKNKQ